MGNRTAQQKTSNGLTTRTTPSHNRLNQLVSASHQNSGTSQTRTWNANDYDESGNLSVNRALDGSRTHYTYDDLDRLTRIEWRNAAGVSLRKSEWVYDFAGRKVINREFSFVDGAWSQQSEVRRVYDGMDVVQERNAQNQVTAHITRDGNIGGILSRTRIDGAGLIVTSARLVSLRLRIKLTALTGNSPSASGNLSGQFIAIRKRTDSRLLPQRPIKRGP